MHCPFCKHEQTQVIDSRTSEDGTTIRRRRRCLKCEKRFTTYERVELSMPSIIKRGGGRCEYDQKKLRASMMLALRKRPVSRERVDEAINRIEQKMLALGEREVRSDRLGELVMEELRGLDKSPMFALPAFIAILKTFKNLLIWLERSSQRCSLQIETICERL